MDKAMKSVLHVALIAPGGYSNVGLMKAFFDNGFSEYTCFDFQEKIFNSDRGSMRRMLIQEAERLRPDMVFLQIQGSDILDLETFQILSKISFTVNYTFDIRTKDQTEWLYDLAPVLGLICFSNQRDVDECKARAFNNTMCLQSSADFEIYKPDPNISRKGVVFVGNNYVNTNIEFPLSKERERMVKYLQHEFGDYFKVYGNNWGDSKITTQKEEVEIYKSVQIAISHNNFEEEMYTSDRIWRIIATGTFCLTKYFKGVEGMFQKGLHLDWWHTLDELNKMVHYYTEIPHAYEIIARRGMNHVKSDHSWTARIKEMMTFINSTIKVMDKEACTKVGAHVIDGVIPGPLDEHLSDRVCDCGKIRYSWQECGCGEKTYQLRAQENI
jgi:hypothetical protein